MASFPELINQDLDIFQICLMRALCRRKTNWSDTLFGLLCEYMYGGNTEGGDRSVEIGAIGLMFMIALTFGHTSV